MATHPPEGSPNLHSDPDRTADMVPGVSGSASAPNRGGDATLGPEIRAALEFPAVPGYTLVRELGEGGFGRVYEAVTSDAVGMRVAIKIIFHPDPAALRSFENEKKILANLVHPNIARYQASGVLGDGRPWMAMEFVEGMRLDRYCDRERLSTTERLGLFRKVCDAVQHAHEFGIWHLDLKPQNILVTVDGEPKLLDFGIAKVSRALDGTTRAAQSRGFFTYLYSSPEQLRGEPLSSRSDVYNLGLILYELLTGTRVRNPSVKEIDEFVRSALQADPELPSLRVSKHAEIIGGGLDTGTAGTATARGGSSRLSRTLRGDLDNIVLMALRREPTKRYESPKALADDVGRHLENLPVEARRASIGYRFARTLQRYRTPIAVGLIATICVTAAGIASTILWREAVAQRMEAERRERETLAVLRFQEEQLSNVSQSDAGIAIFGEIEDRYRAALQARGEKPQAIDASAVELRTCLNSVNPTDVAFSLVAREILARSGARVQQDFAGDRELQASVFMTLGRTAHAVGDSVSALDFFAKANALLRADAGEAAPATLESRRWMLVADQQGDPVGRLNAAAKLLQDSIAALGDDSQEALEARRFHALALAAAGRQAEATSAYEDIVRISDGIDPLGSAVIRDLSTLGEILRESGRIEDSERLLRDAIVRLKFSPTVPARLRHEVMHNLGTTLTSRPCAIREYEEGLRIFREVHQFDNETNGETHSSSLLSGSNLAACLAAKPEHAEEAQALYTKLMGIVAGLRVKSDEARLVINNHASWVFSRIGQPVAGMAAPSIEELRAQIAAVEDSYEAMRLQFGEQHEECLLLAASVAIKRLQIGESIEAEKRLREVIPALAAHYGGRGGHFRVLDLKADLAMALASRGRWQDAVDTLAEAQSDGERDGLPPISDARWNIACRLGSFLKQWSAANGAPGIDAQLAEQEKTIEVLRRARAAVGRCGERDAGVHLVRALEIRGGGQGRAAGAEAED